MIEVFRRSLIPPIVLFDKAINTDNRALIKIVTGTRGLPIQHIRSFFTARRGKKTIRMLCSDRFAAVDTIFHLQQLSPIDMGAILSILAKKYGKSSAAHIPAVRVAIKGIGDRISRLMTDHPEREKMTIEKEWGGLWFIIRRGRWGRMVRF